MSQLIKNVWKKFDLAKEGKEVDYFFRFLKSEAIKYDLQKCVIINGVKSKFNKAVKNISNLNSNDNIVKILSNWIQFSDLQKDDVILSGIIDTRKISCSLKAHLELRGVWHLVNEEIIVHDIPAEFERYIERVVLDDDNRIPDKYYNSINGKFMREEYRSLNSLIYKMSQKIVGNPTYRKGDLIIESTWNHDVVGSIVDYLLHNIKMCRNWDNGRVESTYTMRCKSKKGDFQGYIQSVADRSHNYEIVFGETSYGPNHPNNLDHIYGDQVRLAKFGKISFESIYNLFPRQDHKLLKNINIFIVQSHGYFLTLSIMDCKFLPFYRIRSIQNLHIPLETGPNSLEFIKKLAQTLYNYHLLVKETVKHIDKIDVELATRLGSVTPPNQIRTQTAIPIFETL
ncbi:hypothetical protein C2G38_2229128 [Gigaspora rosea]|uniref:Uncharacterized protein n=1 Tax=Gigaspora rosea TaxID=44941 RepID=A0A397TVW8_9GLOM|nr:hypothetical protein C2G38_2229128 [Gigaspora rosea]